MYISLVYARPYKGLFAFAYLPLHVYLTFGTSIDLSCSFVTWYQSHVRSRLHRRTPQLVLSRPPAALAAGEIQRCSSAQRCSPPLFHAAPLPSVAAPNPAASPLLLPRFRRESAEIGRLFWNPAAPAPIPATCSPISTASRRLGSGSPARLVLSEIPGPALLLLLLKTDLVLARPCAAAN